MRIHPNVTLERLAAAVERWHTSLDNPGFCIQCGAEAEGVEPDARKYECEVLRRARRLRRRRAADPARLTQPDTRSARQGEPPMTDQKLFVRSCLASNAAWRRQATNLRAHAGMLACSVMAAGRHVAEADRTAVDRPEWRRAPRLGLTPADFDPSGAWHLSCRSDRPVLPVATIDRPSNARRSRARRMRHPLGSVRFGPGAKRRNPRFAVQAQAPVMTGKAPPVRGAPGHCVPAPLPRSGVPASG